MTELKTRTVRKKRRQLERSKGIPAYVPSVGARRRIEALATRGYSRDDLYLMLNPDAAVVQGSWVRSERIHIDQHRAIDALYEKLWSTEGPSAQAKLVAARRCWGGPWDWDTEEMDIPDAIPFCCKERLHAEALAMHKAWTKANPRWDAWLAELARNDEERTA